jgi:hypothetical protein
LQALERSLCRLAKVLGDVVGDADLSGRERAALPPGDEQRDLVG